MHLNYFRRQLQNLNRNILFRLKSDDVSKNVNYLEKFHIIIFTGKYETRGFSWFHP